MHKSAEELFTAALALTDLAERAALLDHECADNPALRAEVESLLAAHEQASQFLEQAPAAVSAQTLDATTGMLPVTEKTGDKIGRYKLLQKIGEGGCGVVYMAEQEDSQRPGDGHARLFMSASKPMTLAGLLSLAEGPSPCEPLSFLAVLWLAGPEEPGGYLRRRQEKGWRRPN